MKLASAVLLLLTPFPLGLASAGDFLAKFEALKEAGDRAAIEEYLAQAAVEEAGSPDYYATAGNYWWGVAGSVAVLPLKEGDYELNAEDFSIRDPKTGAVVGAITEAGKLDPEIRKRALGILTEGARRFPRRADLALGLAHVQKKMGMADGYVNTLASLLAEAKKDPAALKWMKDETLPGPAETFLPETVQTYSAALFNANKPATDALCAKLLAAVTDAFPEHPYAYNMQAALADAGGKPEEALRFLEIAHRKAPADPLILMNLAGAYAKSGQTDQAATTYQKVLALEVDPKTRAKAEAAIKELGKATDSSNPNKESESESESE